VSLKTSKEEHLARGAVLHGHAPRLLAIDDIDIEAPLERNLIYLRNRDVPGVIGRVGTILGEHQINIADFSLGRRSASSKAASATGDVRADNGAEAVAVVHVDERISDGVLSELRKIPAVEQARAIRLL
jgi:D-3-phosphoglycerate dehydrogenase / 2-oxoglutarate reductase